MITFFQMLIVNNGIQTNGLVTDLYSRNVTNTNLPKVVNIWRIKVNINESMLFYICENMIDCTCWDIPV
jgi:hypothetical protein